MRVLTLLLGTSRAWAKLLAPIATNAPSAIVGGQVQTDQPPLSSFFAGMKPPFPTNSWWASYAASPGTAAAAGPFPYESSLDGYGVRFGVSASRQFDGTSIHQYVQSDWRASMVESDGTFANHKATAFDTQSVTVQYFNGTSSMNAYLVPGSPYMTFEYKSATPCLTSLNGGIVTFNGQKLGTGLVNATGTQFNVTNTQGTTYIIYALTSITLKASKSGVIQANSTYNGIIRLVMLAQPTHQALLTQYAAVYPTSVSLDYVFSGSVGEINFKWNTVGDGRQLLMLTWPHHRLVMQKGTFPPISSLAYLTTKGWMYPAVGNQWNLPYQLPSITWNPPRAVDSSCLSNVIAGLESDVAQLNASGPTVPNEFYFWGGTVNSKARLALIADSLNRPDLVAPVVQYLKTSIGYWLQNNSVAGTQAAYETTWGGVVNKQGATSFWVDFGNGYYNDHHFHYGYFLTIAATIAKFDSAWLNQYRDYINWFARDIINPSTQDPYFPVTRCRDWFAGHSWASGIANGAGSRDEESTGEAVNAYYGALLWASVALSPAYVQYAQLLLASEQQAARVYWHLYPQQSATDPNNPYPEASVRALTTMGNVQDWQTGAFLWWGSQKSEIAAIQMLPVTPVNELLYDAQWVQNVWQYTASEFADPTIADSWKSIIIAAYSNSNPQMAAAWSTNLTDWGTGNTYTNELFFISTRPNPSGAPICSSMPQNPVGNFTIQVASTKQYVVASAKKTNLMASGNSTTAAAFTTGWLPNAGTLQLASTKQYVTADSSGNFTLAAIRSVAQAWEQYVIRPKVGAPAGVSSMKAVSNGLYITLGSDGSLINNGTTESASIGLKFIAT